MENFRLLSSSFFSSFMLQSGNNLVFYLFSHDLIIYVITYSTLYHFLWDFINEIWVFMFVLWRFGFVYEFYDFFYKFIYFIFQKRKC